jgi:ABC-type protease/lipase transport system fused ATPase/permease subunit
MYWKGFDGGSEAWERIDAFFADLAEKARDLPTPDSGVADGSGS